MSETKPSLPIIDRYGAPLVYSHSKLDQFDKCPKKFWHTAINGDVDSTFTKTAKTIHGNKMHKHMENALLMGSPELHPEAAADPAMVNIYNGMRKSQALLEKMSGGKVMICPEITLACSKTFEPMEYFGGPKQDKLLIGKADLALISPHGGKSDAAIVFDLKTGDPSWSTEDQLKRMAILIFVNHPWIKKIKAAYLWTKNKGKPEWFSYNRDKDYAMMKNSLVYDTAQVELCHVSGSWPAKSSGLCKHCPLKKHQCAHKR